MTYMDRRSVSIYHSSPQQRNEFHIHVVGSQTDDQKQVSVMYLQHSHSQDSRPEVLKCGCVPEHILQLLPHDSACRAMHASAAWETRRDPEFLQLHQMQQTARRRRSRSNTEGAQVPDSSHRRTTLMGGRLVGSQACRAAWSLGQAD